MAAPGFGAALMWGELSNQLGDWRNRNVDKRRQEEEAARTAMLDQRVVDWRNQDLTRDAQFRSEDIAREERIREQQRIDAANLRAAESKRGDVQYKRSRADEVADDQRDFSQAERLARLQIAASAANRQPQQVYTEVEGGILNQVTGRITPFPIGVGGGSVKQPTESETKNAGFLSRAAGSEEALGTLGSNYTPGMGYTLRRRLGNLGLGGKEEQFEQSGREFLTAILRKDSQGQISPAEFEEYSAIYLPMPGDSKETLAQKARSRANALEELRLGAGRAAVSYSPDNPFANR